MTDRKSGGRISFQGEPGANSHIACQEMFPDLEALPCPTFEDALGRVKAGDARLAMIPIENSVAGRVADIHHLLPEAGLYIVGEHFLRVRHQLMGLPGTPIAKITRAMSHTQALGQCRNTLRGLGIAPIPAADTAGSARIVAETKDPSLAAIACNLSRSVAARSRAGSRSAARPGCDGCGTPSASPRSRGRRPCRRSRQHLQHPSRSHPHP
mgnify:CR=1 FL=1